MIALRFLPFRDFVVGFVANAKTRLTDNSRVEEAGDAGDKCIDAIRALDG